MESNGDIEAMKYDSTQDTLDHIREVQRQFNKFVFQLTNDIVEHDARKLTDAEKPAFDIGKPHLDALSHEGLYGSPEYMDAVAELVFAHNIHHPHHPEYHYMYYCLGCGWEGTPRELGDSKMETCPECSRLIHPDKSFGNRMTLFNLVEMYLDWRAVNGGTPEGMVKSVDVGFKRFGMPEVLCRIFENTAHAQEEYEAIR